MTGRGPVLALTGECLSGTFRLEAFGLGSVVSFSRHVAAMVCPGPSDDVLLVAGQQAGDEKEAAPRERQLSGAMAGVTTDLERSNTDMKIIHQDAHEAQSATCKGIADVFPF